MNKVLSFLIVGVFILMGAGLAHSQTIDGRFKTKVTGKKGNTLKVTVQIKSSSGSQALSTSTLPFTFNTEALSFSDNPVAGKTYTFHRFDGENYPASNVTQPEPGKLLLNVGHRLGTPGESVKAKYTNVATLTFTILDPAKKANLTWAPPEMFSPEGAELRKGTFEDSPEAVLQAKSTTSNMPVLDGEYKLTPASPNPFSSQSRFTLIVKEAQHVTIAVYNVLGQHVATLHDERLEARAPRTFTFEANQLSSGSYTLQVTGEMFSDSQQVTLVR